MSGPLYIFAGGGTGGHLYPGIATAEEVLRLRPDAKIVFACSNRPIDRRILDSLPYAVVPQPILPLPRRPGAVIAFLRAWRASAVLARDMVADLKPAAVLGLGGFAAAPAVMRAHKAGIRTALLNPDVVPGKANKHLAGRVEAIFTHFDRTGECFPRRVRGKVHAIGCPIRSYLFAADRQEALRHFGLDAGRRTLVVLGGSLGAESINQAFDALLGDLSEVAGAWQALQVTGPGKSASAVDADRPGALPVRRLTYCDRMDLAYAVADLVLCRAGAVTVAEVSATGTPAVFMPYPYHKDRHQRWNAAPLAEAGAAVICDDARDAQANRRALREVLVPMMREEVRLGRMRAAAASLGRPQAAATVATWLVGG